MSSVTLTKSKRTVSVKYRTLATFTAIAAAVALPQIFHVLGALSGLGTGLGETFLPMHLPIILVGLLAGSFAGCASGIVAPLVSFALTSMPTETMLPVMMVELAAYGLAAGLLSDIKLPCIVKVLAIQLSGRIIRAIAVLIAVNFFDSPIAVKTIWMSSVTGIFGIILQLILIPLIMYRISGIINGKSK